jgi:hypothetical protein
LPIKEEKLEVFEARRITLLQELDRVGEAQTRVELDKAKNLL